MQATSLSPSEAVYFNGQLFAKKVMVGNHELIHNKEKVSVNQLAASILLVSLLASENKGTMKLEMKASKKLFGLLSKNSVHASPAGKEAGWPENSLESIIDGILKQLSREKAGGSIPIEDIIHNLFHEDVHWPHKNIINTVLNSLHKRGMVVAGDKESYTPTPETLEAIKKQNGEFVQEMIGSSEKNRSELHNLVVKNIDAGLKGRMENSGDGD